MKQLPAAIGSIPSPQECLQLIPACVAVTAAALTLWALGFKRYALPLAAGSATGDELATVDNDLLRAISRTCRLLPWSTCLSRSCALVAALRRRGMDARLHIGVARPIKGLQAHAWVALNGKAIGADGKLAHQLADLGLGDCPND